MKWLTACVVIMYFILRNVLTAGILIFSHPVLTVKTVFDVSIFLKKNIVF